MSPKTAVPENSAEPGCHHVPWHRHWYLSFVSPLRETWGARGGIGTSPALPLDPPAPLHLPCTFLPVGSLGRCPVPARVGEEEEEGHIQSLGWARALPGSRGHRTPPGALPTATIGVSRLRALTGWALDAQLAPFHCPHRAGRTGRSQEPGRRLCQPRGCCCLPPPAVTASRSCTHDSLPLSCGAPRPSRGGAGSPTAMKGQNSYLPNSSSSSSSPSGPKARGYGSCPTPQGMLRAPMAGMDWRLPWPGAGGGHSASSGSRLLALTRTRFLEKGWMETLLPPQPRPFLKT